MIVLLSPSKTMKQRAFRGKRSEPEFLPNACQIASQFKRMSSDQLQVWYNVSDKITKDTFNHWQEFSVRQKTIALYAYQGEAYRNLDATAFSKSEIIKVNKHLRILSALYGILRPLDEINPYRLDLSKNFPEIGNGVTFWRDIVTDKLIDDIQAFKHRFIINCSSNEYTEMIDIDKIKKTAHWIQVNFEYIKEGHRVNISMLAKAARGTLAKELSLKPITAVSQMDRYLLDYVCEIDKHHGVVTYVKQM